MEKDRLYEKIDLLKEKNMPNTDIANQLSADSNITLVEAMETIHHYERIQLLRKKLQDCVKDVEYEYKHNEYGIPMIDSDEDW